MKPDGAQNLAGGEQRAEPDLVEALEETPGDIARLSVGAAFGHLVTITVEPRSIRIGHLARLGLDAEDPERGIEHDEIGFVLKIAILRGRNEGAGMDHQIVVGQRGKRLVDEILAAGGNELPRPIGGIILAIRGLLPRRSESNLLILLDNGKQPVQQTRYREPSSLLSHNTNACMTATEEYRA